jgi:uncharacterized glyoxalase superfamily protein PhnB
MIGVNPYIAFKGNCKEAIDFYKDALGAEVLYTQYYGDSPMADMGPVRMSRSSSPRGPSGRTTIVKRSPR